MSDFHDPYLRQALDHAPDREDRPTAPTRDAIQKMARRVVVAAPIPKPRWWQRGFSSAPSTRRHRTPWNAAFATLLVAGIAGLLWRGETIPGAKLDGEAQQRQDEAAMQSVPSIEPLTERRPESSDLVQSETPARAAAPAPPLGSSSNSKKSDAQLRGEQVNPLPPMPPPATEQKQANAKAEADAKSSEAPPTINSAQRTEAPPLKTPKHPSAVADEAASASRMSPPENQSRQAGNVSPQADATESHSDDRRSAKVLAQKPATSRVAPQSASGHSMEATQGGQSEPTFSALASWAQITITPAGAEPLTLTRDRARSLIVALDISVRSAQSPMLRSPSFPTAEWRLTLNREGAVLATLELAGEQVRWQAGTGAAYVGTPTAEVLQLLRTTLIELVRTR